MKTSFFLFAFLLTSLFASAQLEKTLHQTFEIGETSNIRVDLAGEVECVMWAGNTLMTETQVQLYDGSKAILTHLVEVAKRYEISVDSTAGVFKLVSVDKVREKIHAKKGSCTESVKVKVYIPETYEAVEPSSYRRKS